MANNKPLKVRDLVALLQTVDQDLYVIFNDDGCDVTVKGIEVGQKWIEDPNQEWSIHITDVLVNSVKLLGWIWDDEE